MGKPMERVFISYDTKSGLVYAREAKLILTKAGYLAWMWETDNTPGLYPMDDIADNIISCDVFFYLSTCPEPPEKWNGQPYERSIAWEYNKSFRVLTLDPNMLPPALRAYTYVVVSVDTFVAKCSEVVDQLAKSPTLREPARFSDEEQPLESTG